VADLTFATSKEQNEKSVSGTRLRVWEINMKQECSKTRNKGAPEHETDVNLNIKLIAPEHETGMTLNTEQKGPWIRNK
jgi:hypothetical protein